ncbi:MAG: DUF2807 domain-containing protein, partial [Alphaproteobacteria bacterium]|nr:DUF2807 domain-containing protein [Alphaproteobacteria bacterium]
IATVGLILFIAVLSLTPAARAAPDSRIFEASKVALVNFVGTLDVTVGDLPNIALDITGPADQIDDVGVRLDDDVLVIARKGMVNHDDQPFDAAVYPTVRLRVPAATALTIQGMDGVARIGDIAAPLSVHAAALDLTAGNVTTAMIERSGSGRIELGDVSGPVVARLGGSGDFVVGTAAEADIEKRGSGDIDISHVEGAFVANVRGSGDVSAANVGTASIEKHGSGNVRFGRVAGGLSYISFGIGDADVAAVHGPVVVETTSSGEVHIHEGRADPLRVVMREYGDFTMDGEAVNPDLTAEGASVVRLSSYAGELVARGTGFFDVKRR